MSFVDNIIEVFKIYGIDNIKISTTSFQPNTYSLVFKGYIICINNDKIKSMYYTNITIDNDENIDFYYINDLVLHYQNQIFK